MKSYSDKLNIWFVNDNGECIVQCPSKNGLLIAEGWLDSHPMITQTMDEVSIDMHMTTYRESFYELGILFTQG